MKKIFIIVVLAMFILGCATTNPEYMRNNPASCIKETFPISPDKIFDKSKESIQEIGLIIRKSDLIQRTITATPNRLTSVGKRLAGAVLFPIGTSSYTGLHIYITPQEDNSSKIEIVQTYDNSMNTGQDYKSLFLSRLKENLKER